MVVVVMLDPIPVFDAMPSRLERRDDPLDLHLQALIAPAGSLANARFTGLLVDRGM